MVSKALVLRCHIHGQSMNTQQHKSTNLLSSIVTQFHLVVQHHSQVLKQQHCAPQFLFSVYIQVPITASDSAVLLTYIN